MLVFRNSRWKLHRTHLGLSQVINPAPSARQAAARRRHRPQSATSLRCLRPARRPPHRHRPGTVAHVALNPAQWSRSLYVRDRVRKLLGSDFTGKPLTRIRSLAQAVTCRKHHSGVFDVLTFCWHPISHRLGPTSGRTLLRQAYVTAGGTSLTEETSDASLGQSSVGRAVL